MRTNWMTTFRIAPMVAMAGGLLLAASATFLGEGTDARAQIGEDETPTVTETTTATATTDAETAIATETETETGTETATVASTSTATPTTTSTATSTATRTATTSATATRTGTPGSFPYRLFNIMAACDNCGSPGTPTPTQTATATATPTGTGTATPTVTGTTSTTPTATATVSVTPSVTATPTSTVEPGECDATATITALSWNTNPERITITGSGDLSGWSVYSIVADETYAFDEGFTLDGSVDLVSGSAATDNPPGERIWVSFELWVTATDGAELVDCEGNTRSVWPQ